MELVGKLDRLQTGYPDHLKSKWVWSIIMITLLFRYELSGHRSTITTVTFHPQYRWVWSIINYRQIILFVVLLHLLLKMLL